MRRPVPPGTGVPREPRPGGLRSERREEKAGGTPGCRQERKTRRISRTGRKENASRPWLGSNRALPRGGGGGGGSAPPPAPAGGSEGDDARLRRRGGVVREADGHRSSPGPKGNDEGEPREPFRLGRT